MTNPLTVAVIFGGTNTEHEVSLVSARSIITNLPKHFQVIPIKITKDNTWLAPDKPVSRSQAISTTKSETMFTSANSHTALTNLKIDIAFPVIHGPYGEDGTLQGLLEMYRIPYVGCGVLSSAVCMDKVIQKQLCQAASIPLAPYIFFTKAQWIGERQLIEHSIQESFGTYPIFIKPARQGSSIGISKCKKPEDLASAIEQALLYDIKIIVESAILNCREIECAVLGNPPDITISSIGEIIPSGEFYDYDAKYVDGQSQAIIPAIIPTSTQQEVQAIAEQAYSLLNCTGLARIDFLFNSKTHQVYLNELNTMPGFTKISMYPALFNHDGIDYHKLLEQLINLGLAHHQASQPSNHAYQPKQNWHEA